jgi:hypothetical protein
MAIRRGARHKLREYFIAHVGEVLSSEELREAAGGVSEWARRLRELRDEEGFDIASNSDLSSLKPGQYILRSLRPRPAFARAISKELRALILDRNGYVCQMCGAGAGEPHPYGSRKRTRLHIGHVVDKSLGGTDEPANLRAICSVCNEGVANLSLPRPIFKQIKAQVNRAHQAEQLELLQWLIKKYPGDAARLVAGKPGPK